MSHFQDQFISRLKEQFPESYKAILESLDRRASISIRQNPLKLSKELDGQSIPWAASGLYLNERPAYAQDPLFHAGAYYPQEASSMALEVVIDQIKQSTPLHRVLDLCAAPGGKSTHLTSLLDKEAMLVSNEIVPKRFSILYEVLTKWGHPNFMATNYRPDQLARLDDIFDVVVADAPCSGEGLFRKQIEWRDKWTASNCDLCRDRQKKILKEAYKLIRPGGYLIYSTCTFNQEENIDQVEHLISEYDLEHIPIPKLEQHKFTKIEKGEAIGYMALPHLIDGEPFFIACLRKKGNQAPLLARTSRILFEPRLMKPDQPAYYQKDHELFAMNSHQVELAEHMEFCKLRYKTPSIATLKKDLVLPNHFSAMISDHPFNHEKWPLDAEQALKYLRHEALDIDLPTPAWYIFTFNDINLGWAKYDGRRIINKYPMKWRLRQAGQR